MKLKKPLLAFLVLTLSAVVLEANPNDLNKDKRISLEEFEAFRQKEAKKNGRDYDAKQAKFTFEDKDRDGDGFLSYKEFNSHPVDLDGDKSISLEEFSIIMKKQAARNGRVAKDEWIKGMFAKKDTDGDGVLSYQEHAKPVK